MAIEAKLQKVRDACITVLVEEEKLSSEIADEITNELIAFLRTKVDGGKLLLTNQTARYWQELNGTNFKALAQINY